MSHIPGPWKVAPLSGKYYGTSVHMPDEHQVIVWVGGYKPSAREIADGWEPECGMDHVESETDYDTACLIAAAPELLEVAELFIEILKADKRMNRMDNCGLDVYPECEKKVRAALRKARGE